MGEVRAAVALDLLECDPSAVLSHPLGGRAGRQRGDKSAARLALERYKEELRRQAQVPADLLQFDSPQAAAPSGFAAAASGAGVRAPAASIALSEVDACGQQDGLWPGDTVLARYGSGGGFYRARVVRVYSSRGAALADVEWLRPQVTSPAAASEDFLCNVAGGDETLHRQGLQVDVDIHIPSIDSPLGASRARRGAAAAKAAAAASQASAPALAAPAVPDLLDLEWSPAQAQAPTADPLMDFAPTARQPTPALPLASSGGLLPAFDMPQMLATADSGAAPMAVPTTFSAATWSPAAVPMSTGVPFNVPDNSIRPKPATESFDFVSTMMTQATDVQNGSRADSQGGVWTAPT